MSTTLAVEQVHTNLSKIINDIVNEKKEVILTQKGKDLAVIISLKEYKGWKATFEEMQDPESLKALKRAEDDEKTGRLYSYEEVFGV